jgi:mercuric ion transport protein
MKNKTTLFGSLGVGIVSLCCFTPILVIGLSVIGLAGIIAYLDYVLLPLLAFFIFLTGYGLISSKRKKACLTVPSKSQSRE